MAIREDKIIETLRRPGFEGPQQVRGYIPCDLVGGGTANCLGGPNPERYIPMGISGVTVGTGVDLGQTDADTLRGMGVADALIRRLRPYLGQRKEDAVAARDAAQQAACAADRAASKAEDVMARMADGKISVWTLPALVAEGDLLTLPPGIGYYPGHCAVRLSWDGLVCHVGRNFEEVGEAGILSNAVRLLFNAPAGSEFQAEIMAHADAPGAGEVSDLLEKRLAAIEKNLSRLDRDAVRFTPAHP